MSTAETMRTSSTPSHRTGVVKGMGPEYLTCLDLQIYPVNYFQQRESTSRFGAKKPPVPGKLVRRGLETFYFII